MGDSMNDAGINNGDYILVQFTATAQNGCARPKATKTAAAKLTQAKGQRSLGQRKLPKPAAKAASTKPNPGTCAPAPASTPTIAAKERV